MERPQHCYNHGQQWTELHVNIGDVTAVLSVCTLGETVLWLRGGVIQGGV